MNEPVLVARQRMLLRDLAQRSAARARDEKLLGQTAPHAKAQAETAFENGRQEIEAKLKVALAQVERETEEERAHVQALFDEEVAAAQREFEQARERLAERCEAEKETARNTFQETRWTLNAVLDRNVDKAKERYNAAEKRLTAVLDRMVSLRREASDLWDEWEEGYLHPSWKSAAGPRDKNPRLSLRKSLGALEERLTVLRMQLGDLVLPQVLKGGRLTLAFAAAGALLIVPISLLAPLFGVPTTLLIQFVVGLLVSSVLTLAVGMTTKLILDFIAKRQVRSLFRIYPGFCTAVDSVALRCRQRLKSAASRRCRQITVLKKRQKRAQKEARVQAQQEWTGAKRRFDDDLPAALESSKGRKTAAERRLEADLRALDREHERRLSEAHRAHDAETEELSANRRRRVDEIEGGYERGWQMMAEQWRRAVAEQRSTVDAVRTECARLFPAWSDPCCNERPPAPTPPPVLQFGEIAVGKEQIPELAPLDERLQGEAVDDFTLPALCPFPDR
ncbi:MAG TPA: hypothetical protein VMS17_16310, partial [Gemmataceae bacterium]|nr:hypothetical protein [Gemmataceae bacterium]